MLDHGQRSVNVFAVETKKVEGRQSDQSNRHDAEHDRAEYALVVNKTPHNQGGLFQRAP
jgi:hypothetical protein